MTDAVQIEMIRGVTSVAQSFVLATPGIVGAFFAWKATSAIKTVHEQGERNYNQMNGRMEQMLNLKGESSQAVGEQIGEKRERDRGDKPS